MTKIAITTTFPNWLEYPKEIIPTWLNNLPEETPLLIGLDPCQNILDTEQWLLPLTEKKRAEGKVYISREFPPEQLSFLERHKPKEEKDYRLDYRRFSFKVFNLHKAMTFSIENGFDYLIWLDADVVIKKPISLDNIDKWIPKNEVVSYLGRKDWDHSECGFMAFNLKNGGKEFLDRMVSMYITDEVLTLKQWHDSFVFDHIKEEFNKVNGKDVFLNLTKDVPGRDVFDHSVLAEFMEHKKGPRKLSNQSNSLVDLDQLKVQTKNCVDHSKIIENVKGNLEIITNWLDVCQPNDEEILIASAGPSLCAEEIKPFYERGVKIVAVKHALETLLEGGITPWACMLLDPREHVKDFVKHPKAKDINWFVASMVSPEVTKTLLNQGCKVFGYHAYVGAEEHKILPKNHKMVCGGSATSTRGIAVLDMLGFKKFHLFAYDLCSLEKPNLKEKKGQGEDARPVWMEVSLSENSYGEKKVNRTFWTKGEFLAQVQEMRNFFKQSGVHNFNVYGEGIIPWMYKHYKLHQKWLQDKNSLITSNSLNVNDFLSNFPNNMPLTKKGEKSKGAMKKDYGKKKGEKVFYASENKGSIKGVSKKKKK